MDLWGLEETTSMDVETADSVENSCWSQVLTCSESSDETTIVKGSSRIDADDEKRVSGTVFWEKDSKGNTC